MSQHKKNYSKKMANHNTGQALLLFCGTIYGKPETNTLSITPLAGRFGRVRHFFPELPIDVPGKIEEIGRT
jgi:hypothetical protein